MRPRTAAALLAALASGAGCYRPAESPSCRVGCEDDSQCPDSLPCGNDGLCHEATVTCGTDGGRLVDGASGVDGSAGGIDGSGSDRGSGEICVGSAFVVCAPSAIAMADLPLGASFDESTASCVPQGSGSPPMCVLFGDRVSVTGTVRVTGSELLVIAARTSITVTGTLDVSAGGAASNNSGAGCTFPSQPATNGTDAGGGAGGSFATSGGAGGAGNATSTGGTTNSRYMAVTVPRGGCDGQPGAGNSNQVGHSGGAVVLVTNGTVILGTSSAIDASGGGGPAALVATGNGGNGAGTGGYVGFDLPGQLQLALSAGVFANGGGGGGGDQFDTAGGAGQPGQHAATPAAGGAGGKDGGGTESGIGGFGGTGSDAQGGSTGEFAGGGGGGGGGWIVLLHGTANSAGTIEPPLTIP